MTFTEEARERIYNAVKLLDRIPTDEGLWVELNDDNIKFQGYTQGKARRIRVLFPGAIWTKNYNACCDWWEYTTTVNGVTINIYAVSETPPTCKRIVEQVEVEEDVPVTFEKRRVVKERVRYDCGSTTPVSDAD